MAGGIETTLPADVEREMRNLSEAYHKIKKITLNDIINFHYQFERIHPF